MLTNLLFFFGGAFTGIPVFVFVVNYFNWRDIKKRADPWWPRR